MGKFADAFKEGMDPSKPKPASRLEEIVEFESDVPQPYLVQTVLASNPEGLMRVAAPLIAQGWEVVSTVAMSGTILSKMLGMALRMPNPEYDRTAEGSGS